MASRTPARAVLVAACLLGGCAEDPCDACGEAETCASGRCVPMRPEKLWGVDANYVVAFEEAGGTWAVGGREVDPIETFAAEGARVFRLRVWVQDDEGSLEPGTLEDDALALAVRAQDAGLYVVPTLFLSRGWGADAEQDAPYGWGDLPVRERAHRVRRWSSRAVRRLSDAGVATRTFGIGNETDFGACGVFEQTEDLDVLRSEIWPDEALLLQAGIDGVLDALPPADTGAPPPEFLLHVSRGHDTALATAFFAAMREEGVAFDLAGLSYYPTSWGQEGTDAFEDTVAALHGMDLPVVIPEYAFPADDTLDGWNAPIEGYPIDEDGQALFVADLKARVLADDRYEGAIYWTPEEAFALADWSVMGLFEPAWDRRSPSERAALHAL